jgi:hypothetical protein
MATASYAETLAVRSLRAETTKHCATASIIAQHTDILNATLSVAASHDRDTCRCTLQTRPAGYAKTVQQVKNLEKIIHVKFVSSVPCSPTTLSHRGDAPLACTRRVQAAK